MLFAVLPQGVSAVAKWDCRRRWHVVATFLEDGARHLACWCFSFAISHCKDSFFIKNSRRHLVALIENTVKQSMKCNQCRRICLPLQGTVSRCLGGRMGWTASLSTVWGSCWTTNKPLETGRVSSASIAVCLSSSCFQRQRLLAAVEIEILGKQWLGLTVFLQWYFIP